MNEVAEFLLFVNHKKDPGKRACFFRRFISFSECCKQTTEQIYQGDEESCSIVEKWFGDRKNFWVFFKLSGKYETNYSIVLKEIKHHFSLWDLIRQIKF